jgi:hypothetical protein
MRTTQKKVGKAYGKATTSVAAADANLITTKIMANADVEATVAQGRAQVASAAMGAATRAKVVPLMLVPGKLGKNARAEVAAAANTLVDVAAHAHVDKAKALAEAAQEIDKAAVKKANALAKADAKLDRAVARAEKKSGRKVVELPGTGVHGVLPAVAPIVTPVPAVKGGFFGGLVPNVFGVGGGHGKKDKNVLEAAGVVGKGGAFSLWGGRRRLMMADSSEEAPAVARPHGLTAGAALAMFGQAALALGAQLEQQQQGQAVQAPLVPEAGLAQQPAAQYLSEQQPQFQHPQQPQPYNPQAFAALAPALASLGGAAPIIPHGMTAGAAHSADEVGGNVNAVLSPRAQAWIGAISGGAGLALNAAAPLVRGVAAAVPVMVPALDDKAPCAAGKKVKLEQGVFCVLGNFEPAAQALLNGAGLATGLAAPAANGVAGLIAATRANNNGQARPARRVYGGNARNGPAPDY